MNRFEKTVAQIEKKGFPVHSYAAIIIPVSKEAKRYFGTGEGTLMEDFKQSRRISSTRDYFKRIEQIKRAQSLLDMSYEFYYDDSSETEEERMKIVEVEAVNRFGRLKSAHWALEKFDHGKDYDIEVMKVEGKS